MAGYIEGTDRGQVTLFPDRLEDRIAEWSSRLKVVHQLG